MVLRLQIPNLSNGKYFSENNKGTYKFVHNRFSDQHDQLKIANCKRSLVCARKRMRLISKRQDL